MTKKKSFLGIFSIISIVLIIVATILAFTVGINLSSDVGGGTQFEVKIENTTNVSKQKETIKKALNSCGYQAERIFVEDKGVDTFIVVRIAHKDIDAKVRETVAEKLGFELSEISEFQNFGGSITKTAILWASVAIVCVLLGLFVAGWLRYNIMSGVAAIFNVVHTMIISVALIIITRIPLSLTTMLVVLLAIAFNLFASVMMFERVRENAKLKHNENLGAKELVSMSRKATMIPVIVFAALILVMAIIMLCTPVFYVTMIALSVVVCLLSAVYSYFFGTDIYAYLLDLKMTRDKFKLSKNPNYGSAADKNQKAKQKQEQKEAKEKEKQKKVKDKAMKERMKQRKKDSTSDPVV